MITLQNPDPKVSALMGKRKGVKQGDMVRPSQFTVPFTIGTKKVVMNTLTDHVVETEYFSMFEEPVEFVFNENDPEMKDLLMADYLVARGTDEVNKYIKILEVLRKTERHDEGYRSYTILPTTACNARCVYCYELEVEHETMSEQTAEQTIQYIRKTRVDNKPVRIQWFGGEPLLEDKIIDRICEGLREAGIEYTSEMISNGSLVTEGIAVKAKNDWNLTSIQITLDGREDVYCERKRYGDFEGSPYRAVLEGIHHLANQKISVSLRMNVDEDNIEDLMLLADELEEEFKYENVPMAYCHGIFTHKDDDRNSDQLYLGMGRLSERLEEFNRNRISNIEKSEDSGEKSEDEKKFYNRTGCLKCYYCMVDNPVVGPVILPSGRMTLCEHVGEVPEVGSIFDEDLLRIEDLVEKKRCERDECRNCSLLPVCTDFSGCPAVVRDCFKETMVKQKRSIRNLETENRLPPVSMRIQGKVVCVKEPTREFIEKNRNWIVPSYLKFEDMVDCRKADEMISDNSEVVNQ